jgi:hypothetical protein
MKRATVPDGNRAVVGLVRVLLQIELEAERAQARDHDLGVFRPQGALERRLAVRQRSEDESAVGNRLRAGDRHTDRLRV